MQRKLTIVRVGIARRVRTVRAGVARRGTRRKGGQPFPDARAKERGEARGRGKKEDVAAPRSAAEGSARPSKCRARCPLRQPAAGAAGWCVRGAGVAAGRCPPRGGAAAAPATPPPRRYAGPGQNGPPLPPAKRRRLPPTPPGGRRRRSSNETARVHPRRLSRRPGRPLPGGPVNRLVLVWGKWASPRRGRAVCHQFGDRVGRGRPSAGCVAAEPSPGCR